MVDLPIEGCTSIEGAGKLFQTTALFFITILLGVKHRFWLDCPAVVNMCHGTTGCDGGSPPYGGRLADQ